MISLLGNSVLEAQALIRVLNKETGEAVPYATISFENIYSHEKTGAITNEKGELVRTLKGATIVKISSVGYIQTTDTIQHESQKVIFLTPSDVMTDEVVVTASAKPLLRDKSIYKIDVISNAKIRERAAVNLADLLSTQPGIRVEQNGSLGSSVRIQGLSGEQVKILIDGVPVIGRVNGNIDLNQLNLQNADHVEIIEGPMSVIYGSDAMGGLINIITKDNSKESYNGSADLYYETIGKYNVSLQASAHKNASTIALSGSRNFFQGAALDGDPVRVQTWKPRLQYNFDGSYVYSKNSTRFKYSLSLFHEEYQILGSPRKDSIPIQTDSTLIYHAIANDAINISRRTVNKVEYSKNLKNNTINFAGAYSTFWRSLNTYKNDLTLLQKTMEGVANQDTQKISSVLVRGIWSNTAIKKVEIYGGTELNYDHAVDKTDFGTKEMIDVAGFINLKYSPFKSFSFQPGIRFIYNSLFDSPVVYALNAKYQPNKKWALRLSYAKGFRSPSLKELYFKYTQLDHQVYGNPDLKAEYSKNLSTAVSYSIPMKNTVIGVNLSGFYNQMKDKIDYLQDPSNELKATLINLPIDLYKNFGGNLGLNLQILQQFTIAGLTAVSTLKNTKDYNYSKSYTGSLNYLNRRYLFSISVNYKYYGNFVIYSAQLMNDGTLNVTNEAIAGGYHDMEALINKQLLDKRIDLGAGVKNIFNNTRVDIAGNSTTGGSAGLVGYGRTYFVKFTYRIK
jgi:outer membrane receptor for ferrienterochelin and colicins